MNDVAAVIVTYNRINLLERCIQCLKNQTASCDILIVDNASTDNTAAWVNDYIKDHSGVFYKNTGGNIGGAGGFNIGTRWAVECGYRYVWLMDDDTLPQPDALEKLLNADTLLKGDYGWLSSVALWTDGSECKMNRQKLKKSFYEYSPLMKHALVQAEQATFVSLFLRSDTICRVGLPIKDFFIWGDDIEYTRRISVRVGLPCFIAGQSQVIHAMTENNGSSIATDSAERIDRYRYAFRNEAYLYRKEGVKGMTYYLAKCGLNFVRILLHAKNRRLYRCQVLLGSMFRGTAFNPKVEMCNYSSN